ncbi:hypothetical protein DRE_07742 [Drechslerella stenobrocha 248]|uniref:Uncharacterized protein n=1 Tax=Drechslerella stenobrocha 248 TaxID=1043628 RepID=W7I888_9PEZI|nr:hypothetical protein DRE_07742 [Drechslerella stenobrocha 248]
MSNEKQAVTDERDSKSSKFRGYRVPLLRFQVNDVCHDGATVVFGAGLNFHELLTDAVIGVLSALYTPETAPTHVRSVTLILRPMDGVAYTTGMDIDDDHKEIHFSTNYMAGVHERSHGTQDKEEILGVIRHEMVHCFQYNAMGTANGGLIEGIADWVRYKAGFIPPHWRDGTAEHWDQGYQNTAYFLLWLEKQYGLATVPRINAWMKKRQYSDELWIELFGEKPEALFRKYKKTFEGSPGGGIQIPTHRDTLEASLSPPSPPAVSPSASVPGNDMADDQSYVEVTKPKQDTDKANDRTVSFFQISEMRLLARDRLFKLTFDGDEDGGAALFFNKFDGLIEVLDPKMTDKERKLLLVTALRKKAADFLSRADPHGRASYDEIRHRFQIAM